MSATLMPGQVGALLRSHARKMPRAILAGMKIAARHAVADLKRQSPVFDAQFKNAWHVAEAGYLSGGTTVSVVNDAPYAGIIERGARPHGVSAEGQAAIAEWVRRKGFVITRSGESGKLRKLTRKEAAEDASIAGIVFLICKKIREHGVEPHWLVRDNLDTFTKYLDFEVARQVTRAIAAGSDLAPDSV